MILKKSSCGPKSSSLVISASPRRSSRYASHRIWQPEEFVTKISVPYGRCASGVHGASVLVLVLQRPCSAHHNWLERHHAAQPDDAVVLEDFAIEVTRVIFLLREPHIEGDMVIRRPIPRCKLDDDLAIEQLVGGPIAREPSDRVGVVGLDRVSSIFEQLGPDHGAIASLAL